MSKVTLFDSQTGPGVSTAYSLAWDEDEKDLERVVDITIRSPSWNAADVTIEKCHDLDESPQVWQAEQETIGTDTVIEANATVGLLLVHGVAFRLRSTDTGSPLTVLNATAFGPLVAA